MKNFNSIFIILIIITFVLVGGCRCKEEKKPCQDPSNPDCENYDPCYGKRPTADFTMKQWGGWAINPNDSVPEDCDTILLHGIRVQALMENAGSYSWKIGTDSREFNDSELRMTFSDFKNDESNLNPNNSTYYKPIPITLTVRNPEGKCVSTPDTTIQKTRNLVFVSKYEPDPFRGKYVGKINNEIVDREIEIYSYFVNNNPDPQNLRIAFVNFENLDNKDTLVLYSTGGNILRSYKVRAWWDRGFKPVYDMIRRVYPLDGVNMLKFELDRVNEQDFVTIHYRYVTLNEEYKEYTFKGRKIN